MEYLKYLYFMSPKEFCGPGISQQWARQGNAQEQAPMTKHGAVTRLQVITHPTDGTPDCP